MLKKWLTNKSTAKSSKYFGINMIDESTAPDSDILNYLGEETVNSYRNIKGLKKSYSGKSEESLKDYLNQHVFAPLPDPFHVRQGDFGETLARLFVEKFQDLNVPC